MVKKKKVKKKRCKRCDVCKDAIELERYLLGKKLCHQCFCKLKWELKENHNEGYKKLGYG